jgi:diguanylate cyclase (GGDEF)-like protein
MNESRTRKTNGGAPRLVQRFAVFTALGLAAAAAAILIVVRRADTAQAEQQAIGRARLAAEAALDSELRTADLAAPVSSKRRTELRRLFRSRVLLEGITGAMLIGNTGRVTFSTGGGSAGAVDTTHVRAARKGSLVSERTETASGSVLRAYVPVSLGHGRVDGVVALDESYGSIEAAVDRTSWHIAAILEGLLVLLCLVFVPPLARVSNRLNRHLDELEHVATHDELTGLLNRVGFRRAVEAALAEAGPSGAVVRADLDGFSAIDDLFGFEHADVLLSEVAHRFERALADCHAVARIGDDEFAFFVRRGDRVDVTIVADAIRTALERPFEVAGSPIHVTATAGAALLPDHGSDVATVLRRAGTALVVAKEEGRGTIEIYDERHEASEVSRLALASELREALVDGDVVLHYQPLVDVATRTVRGAEGLLRWQHPRHGLLTAGAFIAQAERSGVNRELRRFVLESAGSQWAEWASLGLELEIALNLSRVDLLDESLPGELQAVLERHSMPPWNLILEITERALEGDVFRVRRMLERLHEIGVRLAIDDFGTGYSSLASLRHHPVQQIKLDRSLISGAPEDPAGAVIARGAISIAHAVGASVVAEGVETALEWDFVVASGCDVAQGYLIGPAVPGLELAALVQADPAVTAAA